MFCLLFYVFELSSQLVKLCFNLLIYNLFLSNMLSNLHISGAASRAFFPHCFCIFFFLMINISIETFLLPYCVHMRSTSYFFGVYFILTKLHVEVHHNAIFCFGSIGSIIVIKVVLIFLLRNLYFFYLNQLLLQKGVGPFCLFA